VPNTKTKTQRFDHHAFQIQLEAFLFENASNDDDEGRILRAWELTQAFMEVHACVDDEEHETHEASIRHAWYDLWRCFAGDPATYLYWGIYEEVRHACSPDDEDAFDARVTAIGTDCARSSKKAKSQKKSKKAKGGKAKATKPSHRATRVPHLTIVD
jgi:hypothetical protein